MPRDGWGRGRVVDNGKMKMQMKVMTCTLWRGYHAAQSAERESCSRHATADSVARKLRENKRQGEANGGDSD